MLVVSGATPLARADEPVPGACLPNAVHVVRPGCAPALTSEVRDPARDLPNLVPDTFFVFVHPGQKFDPESQTWVPTADRTIAFDTQSRNLGTASLDLLVQDANEPTTPTAAQCVAWTAEWVCRERTSVGRFVFHAEHGHFHFDDFARYEWRTLGPDGRPDYSSTGLLAQSDKVSFCLMDVGQASPDARPVSTYPYPTCNPARQGISPGWSDIYTADLPGQQLTVHDPADGVYALVIELDPRNRLYESDDTDNRVEVRFELSGDATSARIIDRTFSS
jgi:Lysyl oxidase